MKMCKTMLTPSLIDEKEMTKAQAFLKKKITAGAFGARSVKAAA